MLATDPELIAQFRKSMMQQGEYMKRQCIELFNETLIAFVNDLSLLFKKGSRAVALAKYKQQMAVVFGTSETKLLEVFYEVAQNHAKAIEAMDGSLFTQQTEDDKKQFAMFEEMNLGEVWPKLGEPSRRKIFEYLQKLYIYAEGASTQIEITDEECITMLTETNECIEAFKKKHGRPPTHAELPGALGQK